MYPYEITMIQKKPNNPEILEQYIVNSGDKVLNKILVEQKIIDQLLALMNKNHSSNELLSEAVRLLLSLPLLFSEKICLWKRERNKTQVIISNQAEPCDITSLSVLNDPGIHETEHIVINSEQPVSQAGSEKEQLNIFFKIEQDGFYGASIWMSKMQKFIHESRDFLYRFFYLLELYLNIHSQNRQRMLLNTVLEHSRQVVEVFDEHFNLQYANPAFHQITGFSIDECLGKPFNTWTYPDNISALLLAEIKKKTMHGKIWHGQLSSRKKNGEKWVAESIVIPVMDSTGKLVNHVIIKQDITSLIDKLQLSEKNQEKYIQIIDAFADAVIIHDVQGKIIQTNSMACIQLGYSHDELKHLSIFDLQTSLSPDILQHIWLSMSAEPKTLEGRYHRKDGSSFPVEVRISIAEIGLQKLFITTAQDITKRKHREAEIQQLASAFEQLPIAILITDKFGQIVYSSKQMEQLTSYTRPELKNKNISILLALNSNDYHDIWKSLASGHEWQGDLMAANKYGHPFWVSLIVSPLKNKFGTTTHYMVVMEDITREKNEYAMLKHQADHDQMTNLPNNQSGRYRLEQCIMASKELHEKLAVLFIDLDRFKPVNDLYGHHVGDIILKNVSKILVSCVRSLDFVARKGGDEFIIIINNVKEAKNAEKVAEKCLMALKKPIIIDKNKVHISASIGIAMFPDHGKSALDLLKKADKAMYQAKKRASHIAVYDSNMSADNHAEIRLRPQVNKAINKNQFSLNYQPILDIPSGKVIAAEALLRWDSEYTKQIKPEKILQLAEESGQLLEVERWIIQHACIDAKRIQRMYNKNFHVHVNITAHQLLDEHLAQVVQQSLNHACLNANDLVLEFKEDILFEQPDMALKQLVKLAEIGVHCCIDRFLMAFPSIDYIKTFPFFCIKLDKTLLHDIGKNSSNREIIENIVKISKETGFKTIADGIEDKQQLDVLNQLGCDKAQGWFIAEPMLPERLINWLKKR